MNKKIIALGLAAALVTGVGSFGTYAYFTETEKVDNNVNITMGTLDVNAYWANDGISSWKATSTATETSALDAGKTLSFQNAKPGDTFEREIIVANYGSLNSDTTVQLNADRSNDFDIKMDLVNSQFDNAFVEEGTGRICSRAMQNGEWMRIKITVTIPNDMGNDWQNKLFNADAATFVVVGAHQTI